MIQVVLMDGKKFINEHKDFPNEQVLAVSRYVREALQNRKHSIIEISKWENADRPTRMKRIEGSV